MKIPFIDVSPRSRRRAGIAALLLIAATGSLRAEDSAESLRLAPGEAASFAIKENPSTGFRWHLDPAQFSRLGIGRTSATFHGRDIFAPLAAELSTGRVTVAEVGSSVGELVPGWVDEAIVTAEQASGVVITIDHFGNLISNIEGSAIERWVEPHVYVGASALPLRRTYGEAKPGTALALINSFGVVEIAVAEGRASDLLGLSRGAPIVVRDSVRKR